MPTTLTVADFLSLRMQYKAEQAENEIPAVIEHNFKDGRMVDHYFVVPGPALLADEAVQDFGGKIENILFLQQSEPGAPYQPPCSAPGQKPTSAGNSPRKASTSYCGVMKIIASTALPSSTTATA